MTLLFHVLLIHGYATPLEIVISYSRIIAMWILCTQLFHVLISLLHRFTGIHALVVSVFLLHGSLFILHELLLHGYSCIPVTWLFFFTDIDIPITGHVKYWYAMCETKCHVDPAMGPPLEFHISCFPLSVILFHASNRAHVLLSCYMYHALYLFWYTV